MTTCCRSSDIKSSVYNQTGEGYFQQLSAYNHMTAHLRKVHSAKRRVDSRNPNYIQKRQQCKCLPDEKLLHKYISQEFIDRLAYDTEHHPIDVLRMGLNCENVCEKYSGSQDRSRKCPACNSSYTGQTIRTHSATIRHLESGRSRSMSRTRVHGSGPTFHSSRPVRSLCKSSWRSHDEVDTDGISLRPGGPISVTSSIRSSPSSSKCKNENDTGFCNYASSFESSSETSRRGSPVPKVLVPSPSPVESTTSTQVLKDTDETFANFNKDDDEAKYSKFLYDITQEIVQHGFYTDEELQNVFKKHMNNNLHILDKNKMLYELHQLKLSLNIIDNDDKEENESFEQMMLARRFTRNSIARPPTPPKVLDENKLVDKLMSQDELRKIYSKSPPSGRNTVVLIDANPELLITERDILATLMEMNIEPKQAQDVYKCLQKKGRELNNPQLVHSEKKNNVRRSSLRKATQVRHTIQSSTRDMQFRKHNPSTSAHYGVTKGELLINPNCPTLMTLKFPYQGNRHNTRQNNQWMAPKKINTKMCRCSIRVPEIRVPQSSKACKIPPGYRSAKLKGDNEKKIIEMKKTKNKESKVLIDNQFAYISRRIHKRKSSSVPLLEGLQSDGKGKGKMNKNIETMIKTSDRAQQSTAKKPSTYFNYENKNNGLENENSSTTQIATDIVKNWDEEENVNTLFRRTIENETKKFHNSLRRKVDPKSPETINEVQEFISDDHDESIIESIDDDESIAEEHSTDIVEKFNNEDISESDIESNVEHVNNKVHSDIYTTADENTNAKNRFHQNYDNNNFMKFSCYRNISNNKARIDINTPIPKVSKNCISKENILKCNLKVDDKHSSWRNYFFDENNNGSYNITYPHINYKIFHTGMTLCKSCEKFVKFCH